MINLRCIIEGTSNVFLISISPTQTIYDLKKQIYLEGPQSFVGCDPVDLTLTKVRYQAHDLDVDIDVMNGPAELSHLQVDMDHAIISTGGQYQPNANDRILWGFNRIFAVWPKQPPGDRLHVFIALPGEVGIPTLVDSDASGECSIRPQLRISDKHTA